MVLIALDQIRRRRRHRAPELPDPAAGVVLALALAFGLGGKDWAAERIEALVAAQKKIKTPRDER